MKVRQHGIPCSILNEPLRQMLMTCLAERSNPLTGVNDGHKMSCVEIQTLDPVVGGEGNRPRRLGRIWDP